MFVDSVSRARPPAAVAAAPVDEGRAGLMEAIRLAGGSNKAGDTTYFQVRLKWSSFSFMLTL